LAGINPANFASFFEYPNIVSLINCKFEGVISPAASFLTKSADANARRHKAIIFLLLYSFWQAALAAMKPE
jgi:hypothetical protein